MREVEKMAKESFETSKKLNGKNNEIYSDIVCYLRVSALEENECEEIISDVLEMFLRCEKEGKPIEDAIGNDYKKFCDSIIESMDNKKFSSKIIWKNIKMIFSGVIILLTIDFVFDYIPKLIKYKGIIGYDFKVSFLLNTIIIMILSIGILKYVGKNSFDISKKEHRKSKKFIQVKVLVLIMFSMTLVLPILIKYILFSINGYIIISILSIYWLVKLYNSFISKRMKSKNI